MIDERVGELQDVLSPSARMAHRHTHYPPRSLEGEAVFRPKAGAIRGPPPDHPGKLRAL
jgi:hypothetical protein